MKIALTFELWHVVLAIPVIAWAITTLIVLFRSGWRMALAWPILFLVGGVRVQ